MRMHQISMCLFTMNSIKKEEESVLAGGHKILKARQPRNQFKKITPINYVWYLDADFFTKALRYR
jgi:hypothetical protein